MQTTEECDEVIAFDLQLWSKVKSLATLLQKTEDDATLSIELDFVAPELCCEIFQDPQQPYCFVDEGQQLVVGVSSSWFKTVLERRLHGLGKSSTSLKLSAFCLLGNPQNYHLWAQRRRYLRGTNLQELVEEWIFTSLILTKHLKTVEAWQHRRWVKEQMLKVDQRLLWFYREANFLHKTCEKHLRNYPAWAYRHWLIKGSESRCEKKDFLNLLSEEIDLCKRFFEMHNGDASVGWHLIFCARQEKKNLESMGAAGQQLVKRRASSLFQFSNGLLASHFEKGHEALWSFRRGLVVTYCLGNEGGLGGWDVECEVQFALCHCDCFVDISHPHVDVMSAADCGGSVCWHQYYAAAYGVWLLEKHF